MAGDRKTVEDGLLRGHDAGAQRRRVGRGGGGRKSVRYRGHGGAVHPRAELTVGVLGDVPLPVGEIIPKHELFDYECKYTPGMSEEIFPAKLDTTLARQLQELALTAHRALKLGGYSRVDFRLSPEGDIFCLEAN